MEYELYHYGVKGMKWGIRRYQNKDGSLTPAGKKRLSEEAGTYMNPKYGNFKSKAYLKGRSNRDVVTKDYEDKFWDLYEKEGHAKMHYDMDTIVKEAKLWNSYIDSYADATLKDFGYKNTDTAKAFVKQMFDKDLMYLYDVHDHDTGEYIRTDVDTQSGIEESRNYYNEDFRNKRSV